MVILVTVSGMMHDACDMVEMVETAKPSSRTGTTFLADKNNGCSIAKFASIKYFILLIFTAHYNIHLNFFLVLEARGIGRIIFA